MKKSEEPEKLLREKEKELARLDLEIKLGKHKNVRAGKEMRREIARLKTNLRSSEINQ